MFRLINLSFYYTHPNGSAYAILKNINLKIEKGEWISIIGKNGSGKTTLAKLLCGLLPPSEGDVWVDGISIAELKKKGDIPKIVGYLFSNPENQIVYPVVEEDVAFGPTNLGFSLEETRLKVEEALRMVGLNGYQKKTTHLLTGGEMKRVALAGILAIGPKVLILDEPFLMLDSKGSREIASLIKRLKSNGVTVVSTTSSLEDVISSDRVLLLNGGEILFDGRPKELLSEKERLEAIGLDLPKISQLAYRLKEKGIPISIEITDVDDMAEFLFGLLSSQR